MTGINWEDDGSQEGLLTRRSAQTCLSEKEIEDFLFDRLSGVTREVVEEHLLACAACVELVEKEEELIRAFRSAAKELESEDLANALGETRKRRRGSWFKPTQWVVAAVSVGALAVVLTPRRSGPDPGPVAEIRLHVERGADALSQAPAGRRLALRADVSELPPIPVYRVEVVDAAGRQVHSLVIAPVSSELRWNVERGLSTGLYWVRLRDPNRPESLLREFGLEVR